MREAFVVGTGMVRFGLHGPGTGIALGAQASVAALQDAGVDYSAVDLLVAGVAHPHTPRGVFLGRELGLTGAAVQQVSNASATGLAAVHDAVAAIRAGQADVVLVTGYDAAEQSVATGDVISGEGYHPPVVSFALWANERVARYGTTPEHLAMVAAKNWNYARTNPFAARQSKAPVTVEDVLASRVVADPLTSMMCAPWGEGAASVLLCSDDALGRFDAHRAIRVAATAFQSDRFAPHQVLAGAIVGPPEVTRRTVAQALTAAGRQASDLDVIQLHDAFAVEELIYYEAFGLCGPGESEGLLADGAFGPGSRERFGLPEVSTGGGLLAGGHPGGPTGVAQVCETVRRLRGPGNDRVGLCHLLGAGSVCLAQVYECIDA